MRPSARAGGDGGEVEAAGHTSHRTAHQRGIGDVALEEFGAGRQVLALAGGEIIQHAHAIAARDQRVREVGADEAGPAGDEVKRHESRSAVGCGMGSSSNMPGVFRGLRGIARGPRDGLVGGVAPKKAMARPSVPATTAGNACALDPSPYQLPWAGLTGIVLARGHGTCS